MYDLIMELKVHEEVNLSDLSGYHVVFRLQDVEYYSDERTQALFTAWNVGKTYDNDRQVITYPDMSIISMSDPTYTVLVGNQEIQTDDLAEAEIWLWNNFVASEKAAGQI